MQIKSVFLVAVATAALAGCGDTALEQTLLGAGTGAAAGAVLDTNVAGGALVGAVANVAYCQQYPSRC
ncbi:hypothetical protein M8756_04250 [Lutimaribacter sp. EGI FJ00015]|uniref:Uncharacterized protein n=1 Tax=Lutimaribacter degradans TaxID=2945989 RepID=A0ACC5ZR06_9RHOB|nr:hypothetical protein [Lutimaribacter sp. EGI FJ00013]MCM2560547.1 hypothetical protein [Lutimaribacter sp. EGI FJ00013]MCO0612510.1 hypothetical protein [Lutimaribacter sp. EGI FJ00015]MCO0634371.1 hypothetical protein [Lutimaribacter sp. EGI FJ00014]